jgi:uncharacterized protein with HEPN domain
MHEEEIADYLDLMLESIELIESRFLKIGLPDEFVQSPNGIIYLDAISMRLQVVGESVRKIQKVEPSFLKQYPEVEWDKIDRFRDLVSHHYNQIGIIILIFKDRLISPSPVHYMIPGTWIFYS